MPEHSERLRLRLAKGPATARQIADTLGVSQPTVSRAVKALSADVVRIGAGRSIHYALRDSGRGLGDVPVYRVSDQGRLGRVGVLVPVRPDGFVMRYDDGEARYHDGLPWWLADMRPQGFLGRIYAERHAARLGLPPRLAEWTDTDALRALIAHGEDVVGNLLLGDVSRERFINAAKLDVLGAEAYPALADAAERGDVPGSSAGGEQPKFVAFAGRHVLVKFSAQANNPVTRRWRDLMLAEHVAAEVLRASGVPAARSHLLDVGVRRFLEVERFDRIGESGRRAVYSLASLEAEFVGDATSPWPVLAGRLRLAGVITAEAAEGAALLYAFGLLIGNADMHNGNLSFIGDGAAPYALAPAYDMLPMAFAPRSGGALPDSLPPVRLHASVSATTWRLALQLAENYVAALERENGFSSEWAGCQTALRQHVQEARAKIARLEEENRGQTLISRP